MSCSKVHSYGINSFRHNSAVATMQLYYLITVDTGFGIAMYSNRKSLYRITQISSHILLIITTIFILNLFSIQEISEYMEKCFMYTTCILIYVQIYRNDF